MGIRILKTALAVTTSISLAQAFGLASPLSAGLLAILGIDVTKKRGLQTSFQRIVASLVGLLVAVALFWALGYQLWVIGLYILILYPVLNRLQLKEGIVTSSVVMFHVYAAGKPDALLLLNELALLLTGLGTATLINVLYMPKEDKQLLNFRHRLEELYSRIFKEIAQHLRYTDHVWSGQELLDVEDLLDQAEASAKRLSENTLRSQEALWGLYFFMRRQQLERIERMVQLVAQVYQTLPHGERLATVFDEMSVDVKIEHYTGRSASLLTELEQGFRAMALPASREEFEVRAALLQLMVELKTYLTIAEREKRPLAERS
ncbi:aromatic acid exporter family protein [Paenibacillus cremeus]|uniref:Aromatic acid exporter family protein n=1 Tax=Paenibacillus cremeus TaxID=2163881 RepID=A0A559JIF1_9BACL|nr:aromatic acid exporter family protein [Paenibacillus cremeus]TVX99655.1 aromatic acid exporter family protein [Paenibacillus cremeus]